MPDNDTDAPPERLPRQRMDDHEGEGGWQELSPLLWEGSENSLHWEKAGAIMIARNPASLKVMSQANDEPPSAGNFFHGVTREQNEPKDC